ncbi:hypothetical protein B0I35DRAFT_480794 [Stachybotrys elegans]|uniref:Calcium-transporting ATPase n=1 Tax=Stachybotrys elegans TaxID=80388 RepID=A0A8K0WNJ6_9HYPO|nr:hypothetical protein B0I35DRAFT_480794 [Stachybotrys elegans]
MAESTSNPGPSPSPPATRKRGPTITLNTDSITIPSLAADETDDVSPLHPVSATQESAHGKDSRPASAHNVSSPVTGRTGDKGAAFLSVPQDSMRSRQGSVDSVDGARSISSQGETAVVSSTATNVEKLDISLNNDEIINDSAALNPDTGTEDDFNVDNNPFAFSPGQLNKMFNPKSLSAFYKLGGLRGLEKGLRTDRKAGLSTNETTLPGNVSFEEATAQNGKTELAHDAPASHGAGDDKPFADRYRVFKDNRIPEKKGKSLLQLMWITYNDKVLILLSIAAVVSLAVGLYQTFGGEHEDGEPRVEWVEGVAIIVAIAIVVIVGSLNDYQKERQFTKLNKKKQDRNIKVVRSGKTEEVSVFNLMVGDVIHLEPGDMVPVDGILIEGFHVKCDESQTTGESDVIRKRPADEVYAAIENHDELKKMDPFIQSGARIMEGVGTFMATSTGVYSSYGKTLMALNEDPEMTPLQAKLNVIATYIAKIGGGAGLLLFIVLFIEFLVRLPRLDSSVSPAEKGQMFLNIFIVVVTIIVVAVPEGLPLAVTLALAFATNRMLRDANLVRHLKACEVMGNATAICSDKTGTLTQNKMQVVSGTVGTTHRFGGARPGSSEDKPGMDETGNSTATELVSMLSPPVKDLLLKSIALNSTAFEGEADGVKTFIGSKTETALLLFAQAHLGMGPVSELRDSATTLQIIPFDSGRKCMGIVVRLPQGRARLYIKGASEIILSKCTQIIRNPAENDATAPITDDNIDFITRLIESYANRSLRTIGIGYKDFESWPPKNARKVEANSNEVMFEDLFHDIAFLSMVGIQDPLREGVPEAVKLCQHAGVVVRMVTGDNKITAQAIARECGILQPDSIVMEGPEFRNLSKLQQEEIIPKLHVLARSSPEDKRILVKRLKDKGETVAVTGDGTNDAPALKMADVGFSMGIAGTEVAKEASAIILMDDNFNSIVKALKWGRAVNDAVKRFLQFQLTVNVTAVILTFITAVSSDEESSVLTAVQLLWVNLIMDTLAALALATDPPHDSVLDRKPEPKGSSIISVTMWKMIIGQALYQLAITLLLYYGSPHGILPLPGNNTPPSDQIETLVFNTFVWMQIFNQWNNRRLDNKFNIFEGLHRNWFFIGISAIMCGGQVLIIFVGGAAFQIAEDGQTATMWGIALFLGFLSIPVGVIIRLIPDELLVALVPAFLKRRSRKVPGLTISDEDMEMYPEPLADLRDELRFLKRMKGGRLNNLKFTIQHPRETLMRSRSPSHSRSPSFHAPQTPTKEDRTGLNGDVSPEARNGEGRQRSRSNRSRSNSAVVGPTVMAGIVAAGVAAGWSPATRMKMEEEASDAKEDKSQQ